MSQNDKFKEFQKYEKDRKIYADEIRNHSDTFTSTLHQLNELKLSQLNNKTIDVSDDESFYHTIPEMRSKSPQSPIFMMDQYEKEENVIRVRNFQKSEKGMSEEQIYYIKKKNKAIVQYGIKLFEKEGMKEVYILSRGFAIVRGFELSFALRSHLIKSSLSAYNQIQINSTFGFQNPNIHNIDFTDIKNKKQIQKRDQYLDSQSSIFNNCDNNSVFERMQTLLDDDNMENKLNPCLKLKFCLINKDYEDCFKKDFYMDNTKRKKQAIDIQFQELRMNKNVVSGNLSQLAPQNVIEHILDEECINFKLTNQQFFKTYIKKFKNICDQLQSVNVICPQQAAYFHKNLFSSKEKYQIMNVYYKRYQKQFQLLNY